LESRTAHLLLALSLSEGVA